MSGVKDIYLGRLEDLLSAIWADAMLGDPKVVEVARRVLAQQAKALGLDAEVGPAPPITDEQLEPDDDLEAFRKRYRRA
jgi:hypothetical protein